MNGGSANGIYSYANMHLPGEKISIYTPRNGRGVKAATWAQNNYSRVTKYQITASDRLSVITPNYCSKFLWQAFYYGANFDVIGKDTPDTDWGSVIFPAIFTNSTYFVSKGSFVAN